MNTEIKKVIVLIKRASGYVWAQGTDLDAAQAEAFRNGGVEQGEGGEMVAVTARDATFIAYEMPDAEYEAEDGGHVVEEDRAF